MLVPNKLKAARALLGVKQSDLAKSAGISLATLNNFERGIGDPRASTLDAIERALARGGITFSGDDEHETVILRRIQRPDAFDTFSASRQVLEVLDRASLLKAQVIVFFRNVSSDSSRETQQSAGIMVEGVTRTLLFDRARFSIDTSSHLAEIAGIMLAAYSFYRDRISFLPTFHADTNLLPPGRAVEILNDYERQSLPDPADFFSLFGFDERRFTGMAVRGDHPVNKLLALTESRLRP